MDARRYGKKQNRKRAIYHFEQIITGLQRDTIKEIGFEGTSSLFYSIGKLVAARYLMEGQAAKVPSFLKGYVLEYLLNHLQLPGFSFARSVQYLKKNKMWVLRGKDTIVCRKNKIVSYYCGFMEELVSYVLDKRVTCIENCRNCPNQCELILEVKSEPYSKTDISDIKPIERYRELNFREPQLGQDSFYSFTNLIKSEIVNVDKSGKFIMHGKGLIFSGYWMLDVIAHEYNKKGLRKVFESSVKSEARRLLEDLYSERMTVAEKTDYVLGLHCALGFGVPTYSKKGSIHSIHFQNAPMTRFEDSYLSNLFAGFMEEIHGKKMTLEKREKDFQGRSITLRFRVQK